MIDFPKNQLKILVSLIFYLLMMNVCAVHLAVPAQLDSTAALALQQLP